MRQTSTLWYLRFPDGRVRAAGTSVVRQQLAAGRLPSGTRVRRSGDQRWRALERHPEFADMTSRPGNDGASLRAPAAKRRDADAGPPATIASRVDASSLRTVGVRGTLEELLAALESTASKRKLAAAGLAGALLGGLAGQAALPVFAFSLQPPGLGWLLVLTGLVVLAWLTAVLVRMTFIELSRLRPARWSDALPGSGPLTARLAAAYILGTVVLGGLILTLRLLPGWLLARGGDDPAIGLLIAAQAAAVLGLVFEVLLWPAFVLLLPIAGVLVVEECGVSAALAQWYRLLRQHLGRLVLGEAMAVAIGLVVTAPLALLAALVLSAPVDPRLTLAVTLTRSVLAGVAVSVFLAYLVVANVFLYLKLRYEPGRR